MTPDGRRFPETCSPLRHRSGQEHAPHTAPDEEDEAMQGTRKGLITVGAAALTVALMVTPAAAPSRTSGPFAGVKANTGTVTLSTSGKSQVLTLSEDFKAPDAPDPHWQVVDSRGRVYLLQKLTVKALIGDNMNR